MSDFDGSIHNYKQAIKYRPNYAEFYFNLGGALRHNSNFVEATNSYQKAINIRPDYAEAYINMGISLGRQGKRQQAIDSFRSAIKIRPDSTDAYYNLGFELIRAQNFEEGFQFLEHRWKLIQDNKYNIGKYLTTSKPAWDGEVGKAVFVWGEQGIGDEIMFSSLIPELHSMCSKLFVQCDERLIPLFQRSFPRDIIYKPTRGDVSEDLYDFHIPIGSLACKFRSSLESFDRTSSGYLVHNDIKTTVLRQSLLEGGAKTLIGISWNTASPLVHATDRNIALSELAQALNFPGVQLVCLQYGDVCHEIDSLKKEFGIDVLQVSEIDKRNDIDGLASLIMACDQVVSTTNATVHLAGSLGADVHVLLPISARWIWGTRGSQSSWYNTITPYWQDVAGDWSDSLKSVSESVKRLEL